MDSFQLLAAFVNCNYLHPDFPSLRNQFDTYSAGNERYEEMQHRECQPPLRATLLYCAVFFRRQSNLERTGQPTAYYHA